MASTDELVKRAQKRGVNISESEDGTWHGSYVWNGQEYGLDNDTAEGLVDDMESLVEIFGQDDTYNLEYNEDLDRYIITVEGSEETFSDQVLAKAFASAKNDVMGRLSKAEEERKAREAANKKLEGEAAKPPLKQRRNNGPQAEQQPAPNPAQSFDIPKPISDAIVALLNALREQVGGTTTPPPAQTIEAEPLGAFVEPEAPPAPKKRGLKKG